MQWLFTISMATPELAKYVNSLKQTSAFLVAGGDGGVGCVGIHRYPTHSLAHWSLLTLEMSMIFRLGVEEFERMCCQTPGSNPSLVIE
jgi:hypothetical protein